LEVADVFRGAAWRQANAGHVSLGQLKVMSAIEDCRTAALGGHVARCENEAGYTTISYNSCRNRHCPKCQGAAAREWLAEREAELLPVSYFHVVYTLPAELRDIAYQNKAVVYDLLFKASAETTLTIAADPKHLGARIGFISLLHTWGSALVHHPHVHMIVPGGGFAPDGSRWIVCRPRYFLTAEVLSALFRRLFLEMLLAAHQAGHLQFFGNLGPLADRAAFTAYLKPLRNSDWVVYAKEPFAGPRQVLRYLSRYTHRVAISNRRLIAADQSGVTFKYKDYRLDGSARYKTMTLAPDEFIRRFLLHVLPAGFHPHPLLRLPRQPVPRPQYRAHPRAARSPAHPRRCHQGSRSHPRSAKGARASLPLLRRPHAHHRDLLARPAAQLPRVADAAADQDRYLMMPIPLTNTRNGRDRPSWLFASRAACVPTQILCAMRVPRHFAAPRRVPAARPNIDPDTSVLATLKALPTLHVTNAPQPAAKSP
jgi:hypothetical protein